MQDTLRGAALDRPGIYDRSKVTRCSTRSRRWTLQGRTRADTLLMWMTSLCLLSERMGL